MFELIHAKPVMNWTAEALQEIKLCRGYINANVYYTLADESSIANIKYILYCRVDWKSIFGS